MSFPTIFQIETFDMPTLFSCKLLAILNRKWKTRVKGRDYYDFLFYMVKKIKPNLVCLANGLHLKELSLQELKTMLTNKFNEIDFAAAYEDVCSFVVSNDQTRKFFSKESFLSLLDDFN